MDRVVISSSGTVNVSSLIAPSASGNVDATTLKKRPLDSSVAGSSSSGAPNSTVQKVDGDAVFSSHASIPQEPNKLPGQSIANSSSTITTANSSISTLALGHAGTAMQIPSTVPTSNSAVLGGIASISSLDVSGGVVPSTTTSGSTLSLTSTANSNLSPPEPAIQRPNAQPITSQLNAHNLPPNSNLELGAQPSTSPRGVDHVSAPGALRPNVSSSGPPTLTQNASMRQVQATPQEGVPNPPPASSNNAVLSKYTLSNISISGTNISSKSSEGVPNIRQGSPGASGGSGQSVVDPSSGPTSSLNSNQNLPQQSLPPTTIASTQNLPYLRKKAENDPKIKAELVSILSSNDLSDQKKTEMLKAMMDGAEQPGGASTNGPTCSSSSSSTVSSEAAVGKSIDSGSADSSDKQE